MKTRSVFRLLVGLAVLFSLVGSAETAWGRRHRRYFHRLVDLNPTLYRQICDRIQSSSDNCSNTYRLGVPMYVVTGNLGEMAYVTVLDKQLYVWDWVNSNWLPQDESPVGTYRFVLLLREWEQPAR
ncbi:hypothetical protein [Roseofilum casamattae]|uniref:Uncharacterized protein n=1 Tax=Roseofilum casamattae BLCC-M143 TaxID=3022442 RepID=A0ABT7BV94_9CYAN|nr:hypothetical protein [Roseofilum casamattae]MDJ1183118.1 hypothetical protein [Roseofilum casamattae BLCC-M143]